MTAESGELLMVFPLDMAAHYLRCLELCKRLKNKYRIMIAYSRRYDKFTKDCGVDTFQVENFDAEQIADAATRFDFSWINVSNIRSILYSQIEVIKEHNPNLVLGDSSFTLKMAAEKTESSFVSLLNGYMTKHYRFTRRVSRSHPAYQYSKKLPAAVFDRLTKAIEHFSFRKIHEPFRKIREELGLSSEDYFLDELEGDINLICDLPQLFPQKKLPPKYNFVGPLFYRGNKTEDEIVQFLGDHHPNILVSMGSTGRWNGIELLNNSAFDNYKIVVSGKIANSLNGPNIIEKPFINHTAILPKIDVVICHGGNGTIYQALWHGIPVLCIPANFEQEWNVQRIEELGLGARIDDISDADGILRLVESWMNKRKERLFTEIQDEMSGFMEKSISLDFDDKS